MLHQSAELLELTLNTNVVQVTNVAPAANLDQMQTLFSFLGKVDEIKMYPSDDYPMQPSSKICYVRYTDKTSVSIAQHLTNTVFIDRALIVVPVVDGIIPDEDKAMSIASPSSSMSGMMNSGQSQVVNQVVTGVGGTQVITTIDPHLTALGLPQYPPLPANMDPSKVEEIRRTVYVGNLDSTINAEGLLKFFNQIGEVKYVRMAGDETQPTRFAFVEFTEQASIANALQYNGVIFGGRPLKINHSNNAIVKPQAKSSEAAQREIEEAMKRVREAQSLITAAIEPVLLSELAEKERKKDRSRSRSRSGSRNRSSSRSRRRSRSGSVHRSHSRRRSRSRSHHRSPLHRSRSHTRRHSRSPGHRSRSKVHKSRSRSRDRRSKRSRSPRSRHRSRSKSKEHKKRSRSHSHSKSPSKKKSSKSKSKDSKDKDKSPKHDKKDKEAKKKEELQEEEAKQNSIVSELEVAKIIAGILEEEKKKELESKNAKVDKRTSGKYALSPIKSPKRRSRSPHRRKSSRSPSHHRSLRSPPRRKSSHSPPRHKLSRSPSRRKTSRSPSRRKSSRSPSHKKSSRSPSRLKSPRSPGRHYHSRSPSHSQKRKSRSPKRSHSKRSSSSRHKSRSPSYRSSRSPSQRHRHSSRSPKRWSRSPRRKSRSRSRSHSIRRETKHKKKRDSGDDREKDRDRKKKKEESSHNKESKVIRDYDEEEKGFDSSPDTLRGPRPQLPPLESDKKHDSLSPLKTDPKNSDSEGTDHKPGDMDLDSD